MNHSNLRVVNVVGTGELEGTVNLERLYETATTPVVQYDPVHHQGCYLRFVEDGPLITVYNSGKFIIRANSIDNVYEQREKLLNHLRDIGVPEEVVEKSFDINNIVANGSLNREVDLEALSEDLVEGEADYSAGGGRLQYQFKEYDCTINIFRTGKVVIMGSSTLEETENAWSSLLNELDKLFQEEE